MSIQLGSLVSACSFLLFPGCKRAPLTVQVQVIHTLATKISGWSFRSMASCVHVGSISLQNLQNGEYMSTNHVPGREVAASKLSSASIQFKATVPKIICCTRRYSAGNPDRVLLEHKADSPVRCNTFPFLIPRDSAHRIEGTHTKHRQTHRRAPQGR